MKSFIKYFTNFNKSIKICSLFFFAGISIYNFEIISTKMSLNEGSIPLNFNNIWILDFSSINVDPIILFFILVFTVLVLFLIGQFFSIYSIVIGFILFIGSIASQILRNYYLKFDILWKLPFSDQIKIYRIWTDEDKINLFIEQSDLFYQKHNVFFDFDKNEIISILSSCHRKDDIIESINGILNSKFIEYKIQLIKINDSIETTSILSLINNSIQSSVNFAINHPVITAIATISVLALFGYCWYIYSLPNNDLILINEELSKLKLQNKSLKLKIDNLDKTVSEFGMKDLPDVNTQVQINRELVKELENVKSIQNSEILKLINIKQIQISEINKLDKVRSIQKMQKTDLTKLSDSVEHGRSDLQIVAQAVHRLNTWFGDLAKAVKNLG